MMMMMVLIMWMHFKQKTIHGTADLVTRGSFTRFFFLFPGWGLGGARQPCQMCPPAPCCCCCCCCEMIPHLSVCNQSSAPWTVPPGLTCPPLLLLPASLHSNRHPTPPSTELLRSSVLSHLVCWTRCLWTSIHTSTPLKAPHHCGRHTLLQNNIRIKMRRHSVDDKNMCYQ